MDYGMSEQIMRDNLVVLAQTYATAKGLALTTVSKQIHGKQSFLGDFIAGAVSCSLKTYFLMVEKMRQGWPKDVPWPETRPVPPLPQSVARSQVMSARQRGPGGKLLGKKVSKVARQ